VSEDNTPNLTTDEEAFCRALGLNPDTVVAGSMSMKVVSGHVELTVTQAFPVPPSLLAGAFAAAGAPPEEPDGDVTPIKKKAPKKATR
jgi:hypothetical protein